MILSVPEMSCGHCKATIESALAAVGAKADFDLENREIEVSGLAALKSAGYDAKVVG